MAKNRTDIETGDWRQILTHQERVVLETKIRRLDEREALTYCKARGIDIKHTRYYDIYRSIKKKTSDRIGAILRWKLAEQHIERIDELETINHNLWKDYNSETDFKKRSDILINIAKLQPLLSLYFKDLAIISEKQLQLELKAISREKEEKKPKLFLDRK